MNDQLMTLSKIFTDRVFRIPDYQRGYAWTQKEVSEFWNDLTRLDEKNNHYVGVLTLEPVPQDIYSKWIDDLWLIESKKYAPYYVVDGQQRLTTSVLLIKAIINTMRKKGITQLNYTSVVDIERRFIAESKDENRSCTYLFGYEVDNPSYSYLINQIYSDIKNDFPDTQKTTYTLNLMKAIGYFEEELQKLNEKEIEVIYKKITQQFLFNTYEISTDIDVYVTFETMNNRGKPLSHLELLKNRLIYLSTLFDVDPTVKARLRRDINICWKDIYHILGKDTTNYMPDDEFLDAHFHLYFCDKINELYKNYRHNEYITFGRNMALYSYLLEEHFVVSKVSEGKITPTDIMDYICSLEHCIKIWHILNHPNDSHHAKEVVEYIKKLHYLFTPYKMNGFRHIGLTRVDLYKVLLLACLQSCTDDNTLLKFLKSFEKFVFLLRFIPTPYIVEEYEVMNLDIIDILRKLNRGDMVVMGIKEKIDKIIGALISNESLNKKVIMYYNKNGFYSERFLKYFLCEYEISLQNMSKSNLDKLDRDIYFEAGYDSIEHIYPQHTKRQYWIDRFRNYTQKQKKSLKNSLGNLVAISALKNNRLSNFDFPDKRDGKGNCIGYRYGTYAEIELTEFDDWGAEEILKRGLKLVNFLQDRWGYKIGSSKRDKIFFLGLEFVNRSK